MLTDAQYGCQNSDSQRYASHASPLLIESLFSRKLMNLKMQAGLPNMMSEYNTSISFHDPGYPIRGGQTASWTSKYDVKMQPHKSARNTNYQRVSKLSCYKSTAYVIRHLSNSNMQT